MTYFFFVAEKMALGSRQQDILETILSTNEFYRCFNDDEIIENGESERLVIKLQRIYHYNIGMDEFIERYIENLRMQREISHQKHLDIERRQNEEEMRQELAINQVINNQQIELELLRMQQDLL